MFKKICLLVCFFVVTLTANEKPVIVFDYGDVVGSFDQKLFEKSVQDSLGMTDDEAKDLWSSFKKEVKEKDVPISKFYDDYVKKHQLTVDLKEITEKAALKASFVYQDMQEVIHKLKAAGYRLALLSNITEYSANTIRKNGFYDPFDPILLSCEIGAKKPDPQAYLHLLTTLQVPAEKCIFIDDKTSNVDAAKALHIDGIHYISVEELVKELQKRGITFE